MTAQANARVQDSSLGSRAPKIDRETCHVRWADWTGIEVEQRFRAFGEQRSLWSHLAIGDFRAEATFDAIRLKAVHTLDFGTTSTTRPPGTAVYDERSDTMVVSCRGDEHAEHRLTVSTIRVAPRPAQPVGQWWRDAVLQRGQESVRLY